MADTVVWSPGYYLTIPHFYLTYMHNDITEITTEEDLFHKPAVIHV